MTESPAAMAVTYACSACDGVAATVNLVPPGLPDPALTPEPAGVPPGVSTIRSGHYRLSVKGPDSFSLSPVPALEIAEALASGDPERLYLLDREYAPYWCPWCRACYCRVHYRPELFCLDEYSDSVVGTCPQGHRRTLSD